MRLMPEIDLSYAYESASPVASVAQVAGTNFTISGLTPSRDRLTIGGGITGMLDDRMRFFVDYHAIPTGNLLEQTVSAGLTYKF